MGKVFKLEDVAGGQKRMIKEALRDLTAVIRESTKDILGSRKDRMSKEKLSMLKQAKVI